MARGIRASTDPSAEAVIAASPFAYWRMNSDGATEIDVIGGMVGTYYGTPAKSQDGINSTGKSVLFNAAAGLKIPDAAALTSANMSVSLWFKIAAFPSSGRYILVNKYDGTQRSWGININTSGQITATISRTTNPFAGGAVYTSAAVPTGEWVHVGVTFGASGNIIIYRNGIVQALTVTSGSVSAPIAPADNTTSLRIGNEPDQTATDTDSPLYGIAGNIAEVALFNRILSRHEILSLCTAKVAAFNPLTDVPGLIAWFDPQNAGTVFSDAAGTTPQLTNSGTVAAILNLADDSVWSQATSGYRPSLYSANVTAPRSIRFNSHRLDSPGTVPITKFAAVAHKEAAVSQRHVLVGQYPNGNNTNVEFTALNVARLFYNDVDRGNSSSSHASTSVVNVSTWQARDVGTASHYLNSILDGTPINASGGAVREMYLGADIRDPNPASAIPFNGYLCGAILSSDELTNDQILDVNLFLMRRCRLFL